MNTTFYRELGRSGIQVSALGMGCWAIGGPFWAGETPVGWGKVDDEESIRAVHRALELGVPNKSRGAVPPRTISARRVKRRYGVWTRSISTSTNSTGVTIRLNRREKSPVLVAICGEFNLASINRGPLAMGLLTGKFSTGATLPIDDVRGRHSPEWMGYFKSGQPNPLWLKKLEAVRDILTSEGRTLAQGAFAWLWARSQQTLPIPGFKTIGQVEENCAALHHGPLMAEQMREIDGLLERQSRKERHDHDW